MHVRKLSVASTLTALLLAGFCFPAKAQQSKGPLQLPSVAHATSRPLTSYKGTTHPKFRGPARVIPLRRPEKPGGGGLGPAPSSGGNWTDPDLQNSYGDSNLTIGTVFSGMGFTGYLPPDENISVGINSTVTPPQTQILQVVNTNFAVRGTSGQRLAAGDLATVLFGTFTGSVCSSEDGGDPIALYDQLDHRWLISQLAYNSTFTDNHLCLAISQTSDATGTYDLYDISFGSNLPDYPKLAVWPDGIYFSANIYSNNGNTLQFTGAQACSFPRSDVTGSPSSVTFTCSPGTDSTVYNILPAALEGTTLPPTGESDFYLQFMDNLTSTSGNVLRLYQLQGGTLAKVGDLTVNDFHEACGGGACIPQSGTTQLLDSLGDRLMYRLSYRNYGSYQQLVVNHSVQVDSGSQQTGIRWYALRNNPGGSPPFSVYKESTFSPDSTYYRWMGSIAQNKYGDLGLGYSLSGVTSVPGIAVTGLLNGTDNFMEQEQRLYNGSDQSYQAGYNRWGDYSSVSVDPTDDCTFWYTNEYVTPPVLSLAFLWQTVIGSFSFPDCSGSGTGASFSLAPSPSSQTVSPGGSASYKITVASVNSYSGTVKLGYSGCPTGATCSLPSSVTVSASGTATATLSVTTPGTIATGNYSISVTGTDSTDSTLTYTTSVSLDVSPPPDFSLTVGNSPQTVTQGTTASFGISVTALNGFNTDVTLSVTLGCPTSPANACSFSPGSTISGGSGTASLLVGTDTTTTATTYAITISAAGGGITHTAQVSLTVAQASSGDFSLSASPGSVSLRGDGTAVYTISITPSGGFSSSVQLYVTGLPSGASARFSSNPATTSSKLSVTTSGVKKGNYTLTISGTSGNLLHSTTVGLKQH